jgi:hypothetical protein
LKEVINEVSYTSKCDSIIGKRNRMDFQSSSGYSEDKKISQNYIYITSKTC